MAETKAKVVANDPWSTPKETWQYVTIPEEDPTGLGFPTIRFNKDEYVAGETYHVPAARAASIMERVKAANRAVVRLFSPQVDRKALQEVAVGTASPAAPSGDRPSYVDASQLKTL